MLTCQLTAGDFLVYLGNKRRDVITAFGYEVSEAKNRVRVV